MKKYLLLLLLICAGFFYSAMPETKSRVIRVGVECDHEPYNWEETSQTDSNFPLVNNPGFFAEGYDVQMAALVAGKIGATLEFHKVKWDDLLNALNRREIDAIFSGMVDTYERKNIIAFSIPYEVRKTEYSVLVSRKGRYARARTLKDFSGARILGQKGSHFDEVIDQIPGVVHVAPLDTQTAVINAMTKFDVDGVVLNRDTAESCARTYPGLTVVSFDDDEGFDLGFNGLCAGFRKTDAELVSEVNYAINSITMRERRRVMDQVIKRVWEDI